MAGEIFISYRRADEAWARLLHTQLKAEGVDAWYDVEVGAGEDWRAATARALEHARIFVLLFSSAAARSDDIAKELAVATLQKKLVVPVRLENIQPSGAFLYELASRNWINAFDDTEAKLVGLAKSLAVLVKTGDHNPAGLPFDRNAGGRLTLGTMREWISRKPLIAGAAALAIVAATAVVLAMRPPAAAPVKPAEARVAVLPFDVLSDGPDARHFAEGLTDEIVTGLNSNRIEVVSRDDAKTLRGSDKATKLAELGVALIFDGVVQDDGKTVKVSVHLDDPAQHATLWSGGLDGPVGESTKLQGQIAHTIVSVLACSGRALTPTRGLTQPALLSRYLHACDLFTRTDYDERRVYELLGSLREVTIGAPDFVPAHTDLAKFGAYFSAILPPDQAAPLRQEAEAEAHKALKLDPKAPDAYLALEMLLPPTQWAEREKLLRQGVDADPRWPHTNGFLGKMLGDVGRLEEGVTYAERAAAADLQIDWRPFSAGFIAASGKPDVGIDRLRRMLAAGRTDEIEVWRSLYVALRDAGHLDEARTMLADPRARDYLGPGLEMEEAFLAVMKNRTPANIAKFRRIAATAPPGPNPGRSEAIQGLSMLGLVDDAFAAVETYTPGMPMSGADAEFLFFTSTRAMRQDPRFIKLAAKYGLIDYWRTSGHWPDYCSEPGLPYDCKAEADKVKPPKP